MRDRRRRHLLKLTAAALAMPALSRLARADTYPSRPVHIVLGFSAGGSSDVIARLFGQFLGERLGQAFVVDNRTGAASNVGTEYALKSPPDGYTLLWATSANANNAALYSNLNFNFIGDMAPIGSVFQVPNVLEVNPDVPVKSVPEFIAYAKANPGKLNFASGGIGATQHLSAELFEAMTGVEMHHVPYRGSAPALIDLLSGQVQVMFDLLPASIGYIRADKLRPLAITTATRSPLLPNLPTVGDFVPGYEASTWNGLAAPKGTPQEIVDKLNAAINAGLADPTIQARLADLGATTFATTPEAFGKFAADETEKWGEVIRSAGIKAE
jgi:tripartite-type tricarboxylate transporter receptor subunit TctC